MPTTLTITHEIVYAGRQRGRNTAPQRAAALRAGGTDLAEYGSLTDGGESGTMEATLMEADRGRRGFGYVWQILTGRAPQL